jgi:23S rRNA pseudouridine1911/1915/1917 synthase
MNIPVIFEDNDVVVINKPAGLLVHPHARSEEETLVDWIVKKYPKIKKVGEELVLQTGEHIARPGIVHRLDRETSGIMIIAKNQEAFEFLKKGFQERTIQKTYRAITYGAFKELKGTIEGAIGRSSKDPAKKAVKKTGRVRDAITDYAVLKQNELYAHLEAYPKTGRTHQIRVHLAHIQHPVLCDSLYSGKRVCPPELGRLALHAYALELVLPSGERMQFSAEEPLEFTRFLATTGLL